MGSDRIRETIKLPALVYTGNFFFGTGNTRAAKDFYEKSIFLDRTEEVAWNNLGVLLHATKDPIRALRCFEKTIELNAKMTAAWFNRGCVLFDLGREEEAIEWFQKALELEPENAQSWFLFGMAFFKLGNFRGAIKPFQLAIEQQPDFEEALEHLAIAFQKIEELGKSRETFERLLTINAKRPDILVQLGAIYFKFGLRSKGVSCYLKAADLYEEKGLFKKAQTCRNEAKKVVPN